ncbi:hypothetical protein BY458DRAFT_577894 [Sporodiniella umbellata]|nr:hypothetical protein BY458DRAFT_577894 [Sporodiniella umbellata]
MGALNFIESMDATSLSISKEEFDTNIERTMNELNHEHPKEDLPDKHTVNYENALHPWHAKKAQKEQPLIDLAQKSMNFVEKLFSDNNNEGESSRKNRDQKIHHDVVPEEPSPLSQHLPVPENHLLSEQQQRALPARQIQEDDARKQFDEHLSTIVSMFPNIEPGVCFMILQATDGKLPETIERFVFLKKKKKKKKLNMMYLLSLSLLWSIVF